MDHSHHMHTNQDHSKMQHDHSHMNHGGGMDMAQSCNMNMLFTWDTSNLCIIFHWWHIRSPITLAFSLLGVIAVTALFEAVRAGSRRFEQIVKERKASVPRQRFIFLRRRTHTIKALIYAFQSFYGLMLMLVFMTYNGWVMMCMAFGAFLGYLIFGSETSATKDGACH
ncbi:unnamed protein product [Blumeria hordei]|uniref:Copper transport protein n=1 Tax=Blumeria hordei TaxID=2867405 RepID=A0A383UV09_BLUHO|nr:unnamed protein product [Blumeria hordei]